jgi:predicted porin
MNQAYFCCRRHYFLQIKLSSLSIFLSIAGTASAQSNISLYGLLDLNVGATSNFNSWGHCDPC